MTRPIDDDPLSALAAWEHRGLAGLGQKALALERLLALTEQIATLDPDTVLSRILRAVLELTGTRRAALLLPEGGEAGGPLTVHLALERERGEIPPQDFPVSRSVAESALASGEVAVVEDLAGSAHGGQSSVVSLRLSALVAIPLKAHGKSLGVIYFDTDSPEHGVHRLDRPLLAAFGAQAALALANARLYRRLQDDYFHLRRAVETSFRFDRILYKSAAMDRVCQAARQVAASEVTVLVLGETGTGKELVARAIHYNSRRKGRRFLSQNAGALPDELLESELFGHRRGAFSGAFEHKPGLFEAADGGTVFLDEIGEASPALQVRLLRLLETGAFRRVGETVDRQADVRIVAATHRDLEAEVRAGRFRSDLYYRLSVFPIRLPSLAERREDIELLVPHFVELYGRELGKTIRTIPPRTREALLARPWPGNVRELANVVQRLVLLSPGDELIAPAELPAGPPSPAAGAAVKEGAFPTLEEVERAHIRRALEEAGGNLSQAARLLGLKRGTLRWRLQKLGE